MAILNSTAMHICLKFQHLAIYKMHQRLMLVVI